MTVTVGRIRRDPILDLHLVATGHDTIRGAAGASLLNAELFTAHHLLLLRSSTFSSGAKPRRVQSTPASPNAAPSITAP